MKSFIAFLRGINVGGQKKIKMADLRQVLEKNGFHDVQTYIQSGNVAFQSDEFSPEKLQEVMNKTILSAFGFDVPVLVLTLDGLKQILNANPFADEPDKKSLYFVLLKNSPNPDLVNEFAQVKFENEDFVITDHCVYLCCKAGYGKAKLSNNLIERKLKVVATARNLRTMQKMIEMAKNS
ncbi:DUF1697 domain-containing protein [Flagellimonas sp. S3867]|uniref:DUF1697 domain-containing protein n=1 Tax=Flagellimonas sp. S3867 TaxID=2768063 RepID=UPI0016882C0F|nr:DUF1697 domain-containing protein [Flagellimonas sp. S3867]